MNDNEFCGATGGPLDSFLVVPHDANCPDEPHQHQAHPFDIISCSIIHGDWRADVQRIVNKDITEIWYHLNANDEVELIDDHFLVFSHRRFFNNGTAEHHFYPFVISTAAAQSHVQEVLQAFITRGYERVNG